MQQGPPQPWAPESQQQTVSGKLKDFFKNSDSFFRKLCPLNWSCKMQCSEFSAVVQDFRLYLLLRL